MSLKEEFAKALSERNYNHICDDNVIQLYASGHQTIYTTYDFLSRTITTSGGSQGGISTVQFKDADREVLEAVYDYMKMHNKNPVPLPEPQNDSFLFGHKKNSDLGPG